MKTLSLIKTIAIATVIFVFTSANVFAGEGSKKEKKAKKSSLTILIDSKINYPQFALEEDLQGAVSVEITVKEDGKLNIDQVMASHPEFQDYVIGQLSTIVVDSEDESIGEKIIYRFTFLK